MSGLAGLDHPLGDAARLFAESRDVPLAIARDEVARLLGELAEQRLVHLSQSGAMRWSLRLMKGALTRKNVVQRL